MIKGSDMMPIDARKITKDKLNTGSQARWCGIETPEKLRYEYVANMT